MQLKKSLISIVVSMFNEEEGIVAFANSLGKALSEIDSCQFELLWINDGSTDDSQLLLEKFLRNNVVFQNMECLSIEFSRNFGHEAAMIAGIDNSKGDAIICLDSDGQHPPSELARMINSYTSGNDIVLMKRLQREDNSFIKRKISVIFYRLINTLSTIKFQKDSSDFFLISRKVASILKTNFREKNRFIRGFVQSIGFPAASLSYIAPARVHGESHYSYKKLFKLALDAIFTFSFKPLRISIFCSIVFIAFTFLLSIYSLYAYLYGNIPPSGYTTIILFLSFSFSLLFSIIAILSLYFEKVIQETRQWPIYIIKETISFTHEKNI